MAEVRDKVKPEVDEAARITGEYKRRLIQIIKAEKGEIGREAKQEMVQIVREARRKAEQEAARYIAEARQKLGK